jgi:molybdate transport system ATP-binding protein
MLSLSLERDAREVLFPIRIHLETDAQIIALSGPSGAGKTSILKMMAGLLPPDRGHFSVAGTVLFDSEKRIALPAWKRRIGFVFQDNRLFPHLSVKNNLAYGRFMNGLARDPSHEAHVIQMLDIEKLLARDIGDLSGGEQQRVAIGRALLAKPQLLLLDEPMSSLDANRKREIQPYLLRLAAEGVPMIYVSHDADEIAELAGRIVTVENGIARI